MTDSGEVVWEASKEAIKEAILKAGVNAAVVSIKAWSEAHGYTVQEVTKRCARSLHNQPDHPEFADDPVGDSVEVCVLTWDGRALLRVVADPAGQVTHDPGEDCPVEAVFEKLFMYTQFARWTGGYKSLRELREGAKLHMTPAAPNMH